MTSFRVSSPSAPTLVHVHVDEQSALDDALGLVGPQHPHMIVEARDDGRVATFGVRHLRVGSDTRWRCWVDGLFAGDKDSWADLFAGSSS